MTKGLLLGAGAAGAAAIAALTTGPGWVTAIAVAITLLLAPETQETIRLWSLMAAAVLLTPAAHDRLCKSLKHSNSKK